MLKSFRYLGLSELKPTLSRPFSSFVGNHEPPILVRSSENITEHKEAYQDVVEKPWLKRRTYRRREEALMKRALMKVAEWQATIELGRLPDDLILEEDDPTVFEEGEQVPLPHKYDKILPKELYWTSRETNFHQKAVRKNKHLKEFQAPETINHGEINDLLQANHKLITETLGADIHTFADPEFQPGEFFEQNPAILENFQKIAEFIPFANFRLYPNIAIYLSQVLRYNQDVAKIWEAMENELYKVIHNMSFMDLIKLKYGLTFTLPRGGSPKLHKMINDLILEDLPSADFNELMHLYHAFKSTTSKNFYRKLRQHYIEKAKPGVGNDYVLAVDALYTFVNAQLKVHHYGNVRDSSAPMMNGAELFTNLFDVIFDNIPQMNLETITKLSLSVALIRNDYYGDVILRISRNVLKNLDKIDSFQLASIIYSFSKMNNGKSAGKDQFWAGLVPKVQEHWDKFDNIEKSRIFYAYAHRQVMDKELLNKTILPWLDKELPNLSHAEVANITYGLLYVEDKSKDRWFCIIKNICRQKYHVPIVHYTPLKLARFYYDSLFPGYDHSLFENACFHAEREYDVRRTRRNKYNHDAYYIMSRMLRYDLEIEFQGLMDYENMIVVDYAIMPQKIALRIKLPPNEMPYSKQPSSRFQLERRILEGNDWQVLDIDYQELLDQGPNKLEWVKGQLLPLMKEREYRLFLEHEQAIINMVKMGQYEETKEWTEKHRYTNFIQSAHKIALADPEFKRKAWELKSN